MPMPPRTGRHPRLRNLVLATAALLLLAMPAGAQAGKASNSSGSTSSSPCTISTTSQIFLPWGDLNQYMLAQGGTFEGKTTSWTLNGATRASENEPFKVSGPGSYSLHMPAGAKAASPKFCVDDTLPHIRFFARELAPGAGDLRVGLRFYSTSGALAAEQEVGVLEAGTHPTWSPSKEIELATALPIPTGGSVQAQLLFGASAGWRIDDVYIDPYVRR